MVILVVFCVFHHFPNCLLGMLCARTSSSSALAWNYTSVFWSCDTGAEWVTVYNMLHHFTTFYNMMGLFRLEIFFRWRWPVDLFTCWPVFPTVRSFLPRHAMLFEKTGIQARCCHPVVSMSFNVGCHEVPPSPHPLTCLSYLVSWLVLAFMLAGALVHSGLLFNPWLQHHFAAWWINVLSSPEF